MTPVRLELAAPWSQVKHSTTGPLRSLNAGQKYCRMLQGEHSAILSIFIKLPFVIKIFVLCIFEWPFYTGLVTVHKTKSYH